MFRGLTKLFVWGGGVGPKWAVISKVRISPDRGSSKNAQRRLAKQGDVLKGDLFPQEREVQTCLDPGLLVVSILKSYDIM